ncbi:MAG: outer membrane protein assembly factor BamD [bacterium]|jgi:outer membrane protein assembly factor BamD|nr:outer membrane protein assembly factor BamD [bacterium]
MRRILIAGCVALMAFSGGCAQNKYRRSSAEAYYENAQKALRDGKCYPAELLFRNMLMDYPGSNLTDDAQFGLGQASQCRKEYLVAIFEFERLLNEYPVSPYAAAARFQIGESYFKQARDIHHDQEETLKSIQEFTRFVEDYPKSDLVDDAEARVLELQNQLAMKDVEIAHNYLKWGYTVSAKLYSEDIIEKYAGTPAALEAQFVIARVKVKTRDIEGALNDLTLLSGQDMVPGLKKKVIELTMRLQKENQKK